MQPLGMYPTDGPPQQSVYFPTFQDAAQSSFQEESIIMGLVEQMTAISKSTQGVSSPGETTATEIGNLTQSADIRFDLVFKRYERSFMQVAQQIRDLNQAYMPNDKEFRVLGNDGRFKYEAISRSEYGDRFDIIFEGNSVSNEIMERQKAVQTYGIFSQNPLVAGSPANLYELSKYLGNTMQVPNLARILTPPPQAHVRTPVEEHELMYRGIEVPVDMREDAEQHLLAHDAELNQIGWLDQIHPAIQKIFMAHVEETKELQAAQAFTKSQGVMTSIGAPAVNANQNQSAPEAGAASMAGQGEPPKRPAPYGPQAEPNK